MIRRCDSIEIAHESENYIFKRSVVSLECDKRSVVSLDSDYCEMVKSVNLSKI